MFQPDSADRFINRLIIKPVAGTVRIPAIRYTRQRILAFQNAVMGGVATGSEMPLEKQQASHDHEPALSDPTALAKVWCGCFEKECDDCVRGDAPLDVNAPIALDRRAHAPILPLLGEVLTRRSRGYCCMDGGSRGCAGGRVSHLQKSNHVFHPLQRFTQNTLAPLNH